MCLTPSIPCCDSFTEIVEELKNKSGSEDIAV